MKNKLLNQQGASLIIAIIALAIITGTSTLVFQTDNEVKVDKVKGLVRSSMEMERNRISSILSDVQVCSSASNFGGKVALNNDITYNIVTASGQVLLAKNTRYFSDTGGTRSLLYVSNIQMRAMNASDGATNAGYIGTPKGYILEITYSGNQAGNSKIIRSNVKETKLKIPMYIRLSGANVLECYAISQNDQINIAVKDACSPVTAAGNKNTTLNQSSVSLESINDCQHNAAFAAGNETNCDNVNASPTDRLFLTGYTALTSTSGSLNFPNSFCTGLTSTCAANESAYNFSGSAPTCAFAGGSRDGACGAGQILWHTSGTSTICVTVNCPAAAQFVQSVSTGGATCYAAPSTNCAGNQYVRVFNPGGADTCGNLPVLSGACGGSDYGQSITRATGTLNGTLNCTYYNRAKSCPGPGATTFVTSFGASTTAGCTTF